MKGIMFNIFESFIIKNFNDEAWEEILEDSCVDETVFISPRSYDDNIFATLLNTALQLKQLPIEKTLVSFGRFAFSKLAKHSHHLVEKYDNPISLLEELDGIIHVEVRKIFKGAETPKFIAKRIDDENLELTYISKRNLPYLVEGLIYGLADYFGKDVSLKWEQDLENYKFHITFK